MEKQMKNVLTFSVGALVFFSMLSFGLSEPVGWEKAVKEYISQEYGISPDILKIISTIPYDKSFAYGETKEPAQWKVTIQHTQTKENYVVFLDSNLTVWKTPEQEAADYSKAYGKMEKELFEAVALLKPGQTIGVEIWVACSIDNFDKTKSPKEIEKEITACQKPILEFLKSNGEKKVKPWQSAPVVSGILSKETILELNKMKEVSGMWLANKQLVPAGPAGDNKTVFWDNNLFIFIIAGVFLLILIVIFFFLRRKT